MRNKSKISTLLPFQGVNGFTNDNPTQGAASLALLRAPLGFQTALGKVKSVVHLKSNPKKEPPDFQT